ncbi:hypothetical protein Ccrd_012506 [Cynara cardunculus var. scolymus]|uniref:Uncharacterized protein n=2 Tax=Cynara cardunculus var. scolymus TaxID=59895 RepID=A0A103YHD5_CYNCS|nr:hypothetical protein Ccrd_012506 [Cynara cardunculus var. scolymus]
MAKQALSDALSLDKPSIFLDNFPAPQPTSSYNTSTQTTTYASSTGNIANLLKGFMKNAPISSKSSSDSSTCKTTGIDSSEGFESLLGFDQSFGSPNGSDLSLSNMSPKESKPELIGAQLPFTMFENWLLDEAGGDDVINQRKTDLTHFAFDQNPDHFRN